MSFSPGWRFNSIVYLMLKGESAGDTFQPKLDGRGRLTPEFYSSFCQFVEFPPGRVIGVTHLVGSKKLRGVERSITKFAFRSSGTWILESLPSLSVSRNTNSLVDITNGELDLQITNTPILTQEEWKLIPQTLQMSESESDIISYVRATTIIIIMLGLCRDYKPS